MASVDPYKAGMMTRSPYYKKRNGEGKLCAVLDLTIDNREMQLMLPPSRAFLAGEIHELIVTDERGAGPGAVVNRAAYLGFFEVTRACVAVVGDEVTIGETVVGRIAGFDETHMPNHQNVVIKAEKMATGAALGFEPEDKVLIIMKIR